MKAEVYYVVKGKCFYGIEAAMDFAVRVGKRQGAGAVDVERVSGSQRSLFCKLEVHEGETALQQINAMLGRQARGESELREFGHSMSFPCLN